MNQPDNKHNDTVTSLRILHAVTARTLDNVGDNDDHLLNTGQRLAREVAAFALEVHHRINELAEQNGSADPQDWTDSTSIDALCGPLSDFEHLSSNVWSPQIVAIADQIMTRQAKAGA